ncbi:MAG: SPFH domain-containing protein [Acidobacteria bacterium]|nr:MAG: SPFH domain-containing protein [Acidobacteriota bacterium]
MIIPYFTIVRQKQVAIIEGFGRFDKIVTAGPYLVLPWQSVAARMSLKVQEMQVTVETKTLDDVFVKLLIAVQYSVIPARAKEAYYELANPIQQIESYVFDEVRSTVPNMKLDEVFRNKDKIADAVKENLRETMEKYGYGIIGALVNDIDPDERVKAAMNEINAAQRMRKAAEEKGEAEKILMVKKAEAEAESVILQGQGIAGQRKAIVDGLRESVEEFQEGVAGITTEDVLQIILMTQYFDMLKEVGGRAGASTILLPHSPGGLDSIMDQLRNAVMVGEKATKT